MLKIKLFSIGKNKEDWLEEGVNQYIRRLKGVIEVTCHWAKDDIHLWAIRCSREERERPGVSDYFQFTGEV